MFCVFARTTDDNLASLAKKVEKQLATGRGLGMKGFLVILSDDATKSAAALRKLAEKQGIKHMPLTVYSKVAGPKKYKIAKDAEITVITWKKGKVMSNHSFAKGKLDKKGIATIAKSINALVD